MFLVTSNNLNNKYYIDEIKSIYPGIKKYVDFQYAKTKMIFDYYQIKFEIEIYISGNYFLPSDAFILNVLGPNIKVDDLQLTLVQNEIDYSIPNIQYDTCKIYKTQFEINIIENNFFNEKLNKKFDYDYSLDINTDSFNQNSNIDIIVFNDFVNELKSTKITNNLYYQSTININESNQYHLLYEYWSDNLKRYNFKKNDINFVLNDYENNKNKIIELFKFNLKNPKTILISNVKIELYYLYNEQYKNAKLVFENGYDFYGQNISFKLNTYETYFDQYKKEVIFQPGNNGITFPFETKGYYKIDFVIIIDNKPTNISIDNNYSYSPNTDILFEVENILDELFDYEEITI